MKADFNYIRDLIVEFTSQKNIISTFRIIDDQEISGWEIWFQIEFARFLAEHSSEPQWDRELKIEFDYRKEKEKYFFKPDFLIRKKWWPQESYAALEIKQHPSAAICISNMVNDLQKVSKVRNSELNLRSYWALGIFKTDTTDNPVKLVKEKCSIGNIYTTESLLHTNEIKKTSFSYALF